MPAIPDEGCQLCPRRCIAARTATDPGFCGAAEQRNFRVARLMAHFGEEPCISGSRGSGAVFFSGCNLGCRFCQNAAISLRHQGTELSPEQLVAAIRRLVSQGVHNLNLVTASHYADRIPALIGRLRLLPEWQADPLPVVWNSSAYETAASLAMLKGSVDIYLPDLKYYDKVLSGDLAGAPDYFAVASRAILSMQKQQPEQVFSPGGLLQRGLIIRHLILPGHWRDSCRILDFLAANVPLDTALSLMCQYTPQPGLDLPDNYPELKRRLTTLEYRKVLDYAQNLGFNRISGQQRESADQTYIPDFSALWSDGLW